MSADEQSPTGRYIDWLVNLAAKNVAKGVIEEPRTYFDSIFLLPNGVVSDGDRNVFINGEQFPVRITHAAMAIRPDFQQGSGLDERDIQRMGMRFTFHDQYYQSREFLPVPLWATKVVAGPAALASGFSSQTFDRPVILSARDSLRVQVALEAAPATPRVVSVSFTGVGLLSKRPYFLGSEVELSDTAPVVLNTADFRNDGAEPIALTDWVIHCSSERDNATGAGDIRLVRVQVRQIGNGTGADWFVGPTSPPLSQCPATLLGTTQGRAVVHQFPGEGLIWEPGEGIVVQGLALNSGVEGLSLAVGLSGYICLV
jgi:hypothetical protein